MVLMYLVLRIPATYVLHIQKHRGLRVGTVAFPDTFILFSFFSRSIGSSKERDCTRLLAE